jgi:hypothetical protein
MNQVGLGGLLPGLLMVVVLLLTGGAQAVTLHVSPQGNDAWSGRAAAGPGPEGPFATLTRARDEIRQLKKAGGLPPGGIVVELAGGIYEMHTPLELTAEDSGQEGAPIIYRARAGEWVRLVGGKVLGGWQPVTEEAVLGRLDPAAKGKVVWTDLTAQGLKEFGEPAGGWGQGERNCAELFFQDRPMLLARWPNDGFARVVDIAGPTLKDVRGTKGCAEGMFTFEGDRPQRWAGEKDLWVHGWWFWDWAEGRHRVENLDLEKQLITVAKPYHPYGYRKGQWWYAYNALSELDQPGEYYLDRQEGRLYFWPPAAIDSAPALLSMTPNLITMKDVSQVEFQHLTLEATRATAIVANGGSHKRIAGCTLRNLGTWAIVMNGGTHNVVYGCDIYDTGDGGIRINGGDRKTLTPCHNRVENNHIHHYSRWNRIVKPAVQFDGVGIRVAHNLIHNAPHKAMMFSGNDHVVEYNEMHSVVYEANDAGAIYAGYNWTMRGNQIRYNYFHHITGFEGKGCVGVYLDDMFSSATIYGNVFHQVTRAAFIGGGRDTTIENNLFVDCKPAVHVDARGLGWAHAAETTLTARLKEVPIEQEPWRTRFPQLLTILQDEPMTPKGNVIARNVCHGGVWDAIEGKARPHVKFEDNFVETGKHLTALNFQLRPDHPALKAGFKQIPFEKIGLQPDPLRASWPVVHQVRPPEAPKPRAGAAAAPATPAEPPTRSHRMSARTARVRIDGIIVPAEWAGADPSRGLIIAEGLEREEVAPRSTAWLQYDSEALYVAVDNAVDPASPLRTGSTWGQDDAVEIALRNPAGSASPPILILRGYPGGKFASSDEAGAPAEAVAQAAKGVQYAARVLGKDRWSAEWRIPWASLGVDPARHRRLDFNLSIRKTGGPAWVLWQGTRHATWNVNNAGTLEW